MTGYLIRKLSKLNISTRERERGEETLNASSNNSYSRKNIQKQNQKDRHRDKIVLKVFRVNYNNDKSKSYDEFEIPVQKSTTVLDALLYAKSYLDNSIAIRYSCRMASCGSCGMKINGTPRLACYTNVSEIEDQGIITCE